jgi:hypothetical protein
MKYFCAKSYSYGIHVTINERTKSQPYEEKCNSTTSSKVSCIRGNGSSTRADTPAERCTGERRRHVIGPSHPRSYFWQRAAWTCGGHAGGHAFLLPLLDQGCSDGGNVVSVVHDGVHRIIELYEGSEDPKLKTS